MSNYKQQEEDYEQAVEDGLITFQDLVQQFLVGAITLALLRSRFRDALRLHYTRLMLLGLGDKEPSSSQLIELNRRIGAQELLFEAFLADLSLGNITPTRALWRAGMYASDRGAYIYYSAPEDVINAMQAVVGLPGDICLGDGLCGCYLDVSVDNEGNATVNWIVDPIKEHCEVCLDAASRNPYYFTAEQLSG